MSREDSVSRMRSGSLVHCGSGLRNMAARIIARCVRSLNHRSVYFNRVNTAATLTAAPFTHGRTFSHLTNGHKSPLAQVCFNDWLMTSNDLPVSLVMTSTWWTNCLISLLFSLCTVCSNEIGVNQTSWMQSAILFLI